MGINWVRHVLGIDAKGRPPFPNTRKQLLAGGLFCLALHPGVMLIVMYTELGRVDKDQEIFMIVSPWLVITLLGVWLLLIAAFSTHDRLNYKRTEKRKRYKEQR